MTYGEAAERALEGAELFEGDCGWDPKGFCSFVTSVAMASNLIEMASS